MFDRETRREKIIEAKQRELKLKTKSSAKVDTLATKDKHVQVVEAEARMVLEAEKEFLELIALTVSYYFQNDLHKCIYLIRINIKDGQNNENNLNKLS